MAQQFEHESSSGGDAAAEEMVVCPPDVPVLNLSAVPDPVGLIDLGALAHTEGERALAGLIARSYAAPVGVLLARASVDPQLYTLLTRLDLDEADDDALVEAAGAAERLEAAAHAIKLRAAATLSHRTAMNPAALAHHEATRRDVAGDELAVRLRTTVRAGADLVRRGRALEGVLFATGEALAAGVIDATRARVIVDGLEHVPPEVAATVEDRVLGRAPRRTVAQLRSDVAKALISVDADAAAARAHHRTGQRRVSRPRAHGDDTASMRIEGPAADVLALDVALHATARAAKTDGDDRTMAQLRFDALAGIAHHALTTGHLDGSSHGGPGGDGGSDPGKGTCIDGRGCTLPLATQHGHRPTIMVTVPLDQLLPDWKPPTRSRSSRRTTAGTRSTPDRTGTPGTAGAGDSAGAGNPTDGQTPSGPTTPAEPTNDSAEELTWPPPLPGQHLPTGQVPILDGYGPISPTLARALAAGGNWYRIVTDPLTGAVLDVGHTRYRPTQPMIDHILARDHTCARPGCAHRASECQLDHTQEWNHTHPTRGGPTTVDNLAPLCGRDHQIKTHGDFHLTQTRPGVFEWTTPTGHHYRRELDGTTTTLTHPDHLDHYVSAEEPQDPAGSDPASTNTAYGPPPF